MDYSLPVEYSYTCKCENGRELHFVCTNEALPELVRGYLASENAGEPPYTEVKRRYSADYLLRCLDTADKAAVQYRKTGGMHFAALFDGSGMLSFYEDISRHNSVDKLLGDCVGRGVDAKDAILLLSGRISSEIVRKAGILGVSVIASQSKAMLNAYRLAEEANITLVGYLGKSSMQIYCAGERLTE